jgi:hypothetical protein
MTNSLAIVLQCKPFLFVGSITYSFSVVALVNLSPVDRAERQDSVQYCRLA